MTEADPAETNALKAPLRGRSAVVTGASSGIGAAIANELAAAGCDVLLHARANREGLDRVADRISRKGIDAGRYLGDLSDRTTHESLVAAAWAWRPRIDFWVNNAGADVLTGDAANCSFEEKFDRLWRVDVDATVRLSRLAGARMAAQRTEPAATGAPVILNIGWDQADRGMGGDSGEMFAAVKGAVMAFSRSLAISLAPRVRVNCLAPGWIETSWAQQSSDYWRERAANESLMGRWGQPEDVANAARFLVSDDASFISGQVVVVNGGFRNAYTLSGAPETAE